jgi:hypothetical protein
MDFQELNGDQSRELINSSQRFEAYRDAQQRERGYRGSMSFVERSGTEYLLRDYYDEKTGLLRQKSLGRRDPNTEAIYQEFKSGKADAAARRQELMESLQRQAAVNRAVRLGRVPEISAKIVRALDDAGLLGHGIKIVGTNAIFAYEAAAAIHLPSELTTTEDIDMLFDARARIRLALDEDVPERTLLGLLRRVDKSFSKTPRTFQAANASGFLVDLIMPERNPPWTREAASVSNNSSDLEPSPIGGLAWHESAPAFEAMAIDARGFPVRIIAPDPRAFAVHKFWLSEQPNRNPAKRRRDRLQAEAVAHLTVRYLQHLPFETGALKSFPKSIVESARHLFGK